VSAHYRGSGISVSVTSVEATPERLDRAQLPNISNAMLTLKQPSFVYFNHIKERKAVYF